MALIERIFGNFTKRNKKRIDNIVKEVNSKKNEMRNLTERDFLNKTNEFRRRLRNGESINNILIEALALVREATRRMTGKEPYDVQLEAAAIMSDEVIAEMKTGEGKSLVQILIAYLNALEATKSENKSEWTSVHIMTSNDALSKRDAEDNRKVFELLGLTCSFATRDIGVNVLPKDVNRIRQENKLKRKQAYMCDIVYATSKTIAFDYLEDNSIYDKKDKIIRRKFSHAIIDEADDILFDQARTPLILSTSANLNEEFILEENKVKEYYKEATKLLYGKENSIIAKREGKELSGTEIERIKPGETPVFNTHYCYVKETGDIFLTKKLEEALFKGYETASREEQERCNLIYDALLNCIKAKHAFLNGREYLLTNGEKINTKKVTLIDQNIGRFKESSKYVGDIQYAIEAKEEFFAQKNNRPFKIESTKRNRTKAMITYPAFLKLYSHVSGMTGTSDIEEFRELYGLETYKVQTRLPVRRKEEQDELYVSKYAKYKAILEEVKKCRKAGQPVLIGTTSVKESEELSKLLHDSGINHQLLNAKVDKEEENKIIASAGQKNMVTIATNMAGRGTDIKLDKDIKDLGLYVIGTSKNMSERIDRQLIGRCARQGDKGRSKYFISLDDTVVTSYYKNLKEFKKVYENAPKGKINSKRLIKLINNAQRILDSKNKQNRRMSEKWNKVQDNLRDVIYKMREKILNAEPFELLNYIKKKVIPDYSGYLVKNRSIEQMHEEVGHLIDVEKCYSQNQDEFISNIEKELYLNWYNQGKGKNNKELLKYIEELRIKMLKVLDDYWIMELDSLENLKSNYTIGFITEDPFKKFEYNAYMEFSNVLMPNVMNEIITYSIKPEIKFGKYQIEEKLPEKKTELV